MVFGVAIAPPKACSACVSTASITVVRLFLIDAEERVQETYAPRFLGAVSLKPAAAGCPWFTRSLFIFFGVCCNPYL